MTCSRIGREVSGATSSRALPKREWNNWKGRTAPEATLRLVASVHDEMQMMLDAPSAEQILGRGQGWSSLPSGDSSKGSRLEKVVARLCRCGITTVMQARRFFQGGERPEPRQRGTKRPPTEAESDDGGRSCTDGLDALWPEGTQGSQASLQGNPKMQELGDVRGRYLPQASLQPHEHAIVVIIGRIIIWGTVNAVPQRTLEGLMAQMALANIQLGEKYHEAWFASLFSSLASRMCQRLTCSRFHDTPLNLPFPSAFRLVWDGITLRNGATVIPILVVFTDHSGRIASELVDVPISQGSRGPEVAALVHGVLEKLICLSQKIVFRSVSGLRVQGVASSSAPASSQGAAGQRMGNRSDLLTSMLVDHAYSGKIGNKADEIYVRCWG